MTKAVKEVSKLISWQIILPKSEFLSVVGLYFVYQWRVVHNNVFSGSDSNWKKGILITSLKFCSIRKTPFFYFGLILGFIDITA